MPKGKYIISAFQLLKNWPAGKKITNDWAIITKSKN